MSTEPNLEDNLRRSKRKKFKLDVVAAAHGNNQKKSRRDPHGMDDFSDDDDFEMGELSIDTQMDIKEEDDDYEGDTSLSKRRARRSTAHWGDYQEPFADWVEQVGEFACPKCPSRYESRSSLANHSKMHNGEKRKFACELCDFSATTQKSLMHHNNVHKRFGVISAQTSPVISAINGSANVSMVSNASKASTSSKASVTPKSSKVKVEEPEEAAPELEEPGSSNSGQSNSFNNNAAPELFAAEEPFGKESDAEDDDDEAAPPILEREVPESPPLLQAEEADRESSVESEAEAEAPKIIPAVRKSSRPPRPKKSLSPIKTPKKEKKEKKINQVKAKLQKLPLALPLLSSEVKNGSLPGSDSASSTSGSGPSSSTATPPEKRSLEREEPSQSPDATDATPKRRRYACHDCPFSANSSIRLEKHVDGHKMEQGFQCAAEGCTYKTRTAGFMMRHYAIHDMELPWPPIFVKMGGRQQVVKEEEEQAPELTPELETMEQEPMEDEEVEDVQAEEVEETIQESKEATPEDEEEEEEEEIEKEMRILPILNAKTALDKTALFGAAFLRSGIPVPTPSEPNLVCCNILECKFTTTSTMAMIVHKLRGHKVQSMDPERRHVCYTCGHRTHTSRELQVHKLLRHPLSTRSRFHRTYYLKEIVGDKFFVNYYITGEGKVPAVNGNSTANAQEADPEDLDSEDDSFDPTNANLPPEALEAIQKQATFCCNLCPYTTNTMNKCQRHHAKHFTPATYKCRHCSWSSKKKEVVGAHEKLHDPKEEKEKTEDVVEEPSEPKKEAPKEYYAVEMFENPETVQLGESLRKWCKKEKAQRPELDDAFTRKMIEGIKGFQCVECPYTSKYRGDMRTHKKRHDIDQTYRCVQCTYTTNRPVSLKDHMKQHIPVNMAMEDVKPTSLFANEGILMGTRKGTGRSRIYCCNKCPYITSTLGCLWRHQRYHRRIAKFYICSNCTYSSVDMRKMEEHTVIHTAFGNNEQMPFVKRVDQEGNPVVSLTDLNLDKAAERKLKKKMMEEEKKIKEKEKEAALAAAMAPPPAKKRKIVEEKEKKEEVEEPEEVEMEPISEEGSRPSTSIAAREPSEEQQSQPTRQLSDRTTRTKIDYSVMSGGKVKLPASVVAASKKDKEKKERKEKRDAESGETVEETHWKLRKALNLEEDLGKEVLKCKDCPYQTTNPDHLSRHEFFHVKVEPARPYSCCDCSFSSLTASCMIQHLKVHSEGITYDPATRKMHKHRKNDTIPAGVKGFTCKSCNYKTVSRQFYAEHTAYHRHMLNNRISSQAKRGAVKEEYQRPKLKYHGIARNAKYCKKCTFKCTSQSSFVEHVDRHGWKQMYKCYMCDYSDNNKAVVNFHQVHHHILKDQPFQTLNRVAEFRVDKGTIQEPESTRSKPTCEEFGKVSTGILKCGCCDYVCHVGSELAFHMSNNHKDEPGARETISWLQMNMLPPEVVTKSFPPSV